jgi:alpha-1,3-rhamnosyl/mannosyltransferase
VYDASPCYSLDELLLLGRRTDVSNFDLFHTPHYILPYGISIPSVVTVHDLIHIDYPERFFYPWVARSLIRSSVARAEAVLSVSRATQKAVIDLTHASEEKIQFIPNAIAPFLLQPHAGSVLDLPSPIQGIGQYFLAVISNVKPHKAPGDLLRAFQAFRENQMWRGIAATAPTLVLVGYGCGDLTRSSTLANLAQETENVLVLGAVGSGELSALYSKAAAVVIPSLAEGFCLPALEAQARGTPVVCRPVDALKELVTERDVVAVDMSIGALAQAMKLGLERATVFGRAPFAKHLELYSPNRIAERVYSVYDRVVSSGGHR